MRYLARSALGWRFFCLGANGEGRPKNLRRGYFTRKSGIPSLMVKALERSLFFKPWLAELARWTKGGLTGKAHE
jgi:hypothetical protein